MTILSASFVPNVLSKQLSAKIELITNNDLEEDRASVTELDEIKLQSKLVHPVTVFCHIPETQVCMKIQDLHAEVFSTPPEA